MTEPSRSLQARFDALAAALTQEIRKPLSTVTMTLELLREELRAGAGASVATRRVDAALEELKRFDRTFGEFMNFAHEPRIEPVPVDVNQAIEESLAALAAMVRARRVTPVLQLDRRAGSVRADVQMLRRALVCLLENVVGTLDGGIVTIQTRGEAHAFLIDVIDTGRPHPPDAGARIFDSFFTTMGGQNGVGLALTRQIVEAHGGAVGFDSAPAAGNRYSLALPRGGGA